MDLSKTDIGTIQISDPGEIKEGRYNMEYFSEEEMRSENNPDWIGLRITFRITDGEEKGKFASCLFSLKNPKSPKSVEIARESLGLLSNAAGIFPTFTNTEDLKGKVVSGKVIINDKGYPEIDDAYGKNWRKAEETEAKAEKVETSSTDDFDDEIPF